MDATPSTSAPAVSPAKQPALPPGPRLPMPVQTLLWLLRPVATMHRWRRRYGDVFTIRLPMTGHSVQVCDPALLKPIFTAKPDDARAGEANRVLEPVLGRSSTLLLDGREHLRHRKLLLPPFHGERMQRYGEIIATTTSAEIERWPVGTPFPLRPAMQRITLDVILRAVFGLHDGDELDQLRPLLRDLVDTTRNRAAMIPLLRKEIGGRSPWGRFVAARRRTDALLHGIIRQRQNDPDVAQRDDVLSMLVQARDENGEAMTVEELRDELMTLLLAGHETTATSLAWCFQLLLLNPPELDKLRQDIAQGSTTRLDAVIKETMRIRPVVPVVARRLHAPLQIGEWTLPKGVMVAPNIELIHHRDDLYPQPDQFRPDRFVNTQTETYEWLPFGGGIRRCLGASFATFEMRTVIPIVLRRASLTLAGSTMDRVRRAAVVMVPEKGVRVIQDRPLSA
ncbi:MAG TPA: cytochrome P450 [Candidatus Angelobacter sp.]|jgi:cytochrome P450|nr:cytochrome P450 [Candidatus Angelobacter sp.]